jgi:glucosamine-6-phosphate deaminase
MYFVEIRITNNPRELGKAAAKAGATLIRNAIEKKGHANIILATGTSQFEMLNQLIAEPGIVWSQVTMFHLDEYIGLPISHPASFRKYLVDRFLSHVPSLQTVFLIDGEANEELECERLSAHMANHPIDVAFVGIGENGHLAFNDPPADFETDRPYIVVELDEACRNQQLGEGWFRNMNEVPRKAISMSVKQILQSQNIICSVPDKRKAVAVKNCVEHSISNLFPATSLQMHLNCWIFLDLESASLLNSNTNSPALNISIQ